MYTSFRIGRLGRYHRQKIEVALGVYGLHFGQEMLLLDLKYNDGRTISSIVERSRVSAPTVTKMTDRLAASGFVAKVPDENDKRVVRIFLTEKARKILPALATLWPELEDQIYQGLSSKERLELDTLLGKACNHLFNDPDFLC